MLICYSVAGLYSLTAVNAVAGPRASRKSQHCEASRQEAKGKAIENAQQVKSFSSSLISLPHTKINIRCETKTANQDSALDSLRYHCLNMAITDNVEENTEA